MGTIFDTLDGLIGVEPDFISVTYGTGRQSDRTATARIARTIGSEYHIPAVAHLTAQYADHAMIDETLDAFHDAHVKAVLALRGDAVEGREPLHVFEHASDVVAYIRQRRPEMSIYAACYPEGHPEAPSFEADLQCLKIKVDAGVDRLISQLFYDNDDFLRFVDRARALGIDTPIEAGIMPVTNAKQIRHMVSLCGSKLTSGVTAMLEHWGDDPDALRRAGIVYASQQIADLVAHGVEGIHLYTMNHPGITRSIWNNVRPLFTNGSPQADGRRPAQT